MSVSKERKDKLSGAQYKKNREDRQVKNEQLLNKIPKLTSFFLKESSNGNDVKDNENKVSDGASTSQNNDEETTTRTTLSQIGNDPETEIIFEENNLCDRKEDFTKSTISDEIFPLDPAHWKISDTLIDYIAQHGASQNKKSVYTESKRLYSQGKERYLTNNLFSRQLKNGEITQRSWMVYSESKGCIFCIPCTLLCGQGHTNAFTTGFNDWKNASQRLKDHEDSPIHKTNLRLLKNRGNKKGHVDAKLNEQLDKETEYWRNVLRRVVAAVKYLTTKGLALRGSHEHLDLLDQGNFLGLLEFLSQFDPFLSEHLKLHSDGGSGTTSYISKTTYEEILLLMAQHVRKQIVIEVKEAKYFGIVVDSTPDISHIDQLTFVIRYVNTDGMPVERFLCFLPNIGHKAEEIVNGIVEVFDKFDLDATKCRGQSYDNASNMAGIYSGVQARMKTLCPHAEFVPCAAHSLNLVGSSAAGSCTSAVSFFGLLQELYNFFTCSTHRWVLFLSQKSKTSVVLKSLSKTRWSARHDACRVLKENWTAILDTLKSIENDSSEKPSCRNEALALRSNLETLDVAFLCIFWSNVLERFQKVSAKLQSATTTLSKVRELLKSLADFVLELRDDFSRFEVLAKEKSGLSEYKSDKKRKRRRTLAIDEFSRDNESELPTGFANFRINTFNVIVDYLNSELQKRSEKYEDLQKTYGFFEKIKYLTSTVISEKATELRKAYPEDLEDSIVEECLHFKSLLTELEPSENQGTSLIELRKLIRKEDMTEVYPNIEIALRMALSTPATNCTGERSFSTLRRIKTYMRSTTRAERLSAIAILTIEADLTKTISFEKLVEDFASQKARKKPLM